MIYLESKSFDPHFNLAMEQYIFDQMDRNEEYFFLWQNANTIVVGKHQNTIAEINQKFVEEHNISVVRRLSGGGAVYHDMGNLNFTIIVSRTDQMADFDFSRFCLPVVNALKKLGVKAGN
ncbi:MAG: lipoate--protein ligase family protein [Acidaminococcaceae bacterium]|nr:lipoate--protein ligase family protein [Acidaminococcaceae bacterium]